jgi:integrase
MPAQKKRWDRPHLTDKQLKEKIRRERKRFTVADPEQGGMYIRVPPKGPRIYVVIARDPYGKQQFGKVGTDAELTLEQARDIAREYLRRIKQGKPAKEPPASPPESVEGVTADWLRNHVDRNGLRTAGEIRRIINRYILPVWRKKPFVDIRRSDVALLLDKIGRENGQRTADTTLTVLRSVAGWLQERLDDYHSPFSKIKKRAQNGARARVLDDDELRRVWHAADGAGAFGGLVKLLLLTGQRLSKVREVRWADIDAGGVWHVPSEVREKGNIGSVQLPQAALAIIAAQPRYAGSDYVFAGRDDKPFAIGQLKARLDKASGVTGWVLHDLRRSARSLMSRAGVQSEHAERVLGHSIGGVEGIYDRHRYDAEKAAALAKLAALIERIANPPGDNVVGLREAVS